MSECVPDDFGVAPTTDGNFVMLWERYGKTVTFRIIGNQDPLRFHRENDGTR